jgi:hypothetical protein
VPTYIDSDIMQIVSSQRDNTVFLRSRTVKDTVYVYKHFDTDAEKVQMAWSKWIFNMDIKSIFVFDKELFLFGSRYDTTVPIDEFPLVGVWDDSKFWLDDTLWIEGTIAKTPSFEKIDIDSYAIGANFKDIETVRYSSEIELSEWAISKTVGLTSDGTKELRGNLLIKTIEMSSADGSIFYLVVDDKERGTSRSIPSLYTVDRKPFIGGNSKNMRIKVVSTDGDGFQINSISIEGRYNVRSKRV